MKRFSHSLKSMAALFSTLVSWPAQFSGATLHAETISAWSRYTKTVISAMHDREPAGSAFLSSSESQLVKLRDGEILISPAPGPNPRRVPGGLIHHWTGAAFIQGASLNSVLEVTRDYDRYKEFYQPSVAASKTLGRVQSVDAFSMLIVSKAFLLKTALEGDYQVTNVRLDSHRFYSIMRSTRLQEVDNYEEADQKSLPEGEGGGYVWRVMSVARLEERDGGVYVEVEALALSRDIPSAVRFIVDPLVRRASHNSVLTSLQQTMQAVEAKVQAEMKSAPAKPASIGSSGNFLTAPSFR